MDKVYSFKAKSQTGHLKQVIQQEQRLQFYSEEEGDTPKSGDTNKTQQTKPKSKFNQVSGYQTDDSEGGTPRNQQGHSVPATQKMSKFSNLVNTKKSDGDVEQEPEFSDGDNHQMAKDQQVQNYNYNIEEQARRAEQKLKAHHPKLQKSKQTTSMQQLNVNSDNEQVKRNQAEQGKDRLNNHPFRHLIFGPQVSEQTFKKHLILTQRGLIYARKCLKGPSEKFIQSKKVALPEGNNKREKTLVLDLDETLIHSCTARENPQVYITAVGEFGEEAKIGVNIRPYTSLFLQQMSEFYTIYIYTASSQAYANAIIQYLDPNKNYIAGMMTRNNCMETKNGFFIKDLRLISNKDLKDILIVDNLAHSFGFQIENGIPILEWHNDSNDQELRYLSHYLVEASKYNDVREFNTKKLRLDDLIEFRLEEVN